MTNYSVVCMSILKAASYAGAPDPAAFSRIRDSVLADGGDDERAAKEMASALSDGLNKGNWPTV